MLESAVAALQQADGLLITAGAGMGVDSGLPDFRGTQGFWRHYPALGQQGLRFEEIANARMFERDPTLAWGFYGHRLNRYRTTRPHAGFALLAELAARLPQGGFVLTSNVDGQFQRAGFAERALHECHGSIHHLQCLHDCKQRIWSADGFDPEVDETVCRLRSQLPRCPDCGALARPNILMFGDWGWNARRAQQQQDRLRAWLSRCQRPVVIEVGAGVAIPTIRHAGEDLGCFLIRINPRDSMLPLSCPGIALEEGALDGIRLLHQKLLGRGRQHER